jgi:hypothetical protein
MRSQVQPGERVEITDVHSLAALVARDPHFPERRRRLIRLVAVTVGGCALILVAAVTARLAHRSADAATTTPITIASVAPSAAPPAVPSAPTTAASVAAIDVSPTTGTLRLQHPALPGHVWLDGTKLTASMATVSCGKHKVKVGTWGRSHTVDIPCGGELKVAK